MPFKGQNFSQYGRFKRNTLKLNWLQKKKNFFRTKPCSSAPCWRNPAKCSPPTNPPRSLPPTPPRRPWESGCTARRLETRWRPPLPNQTWMSSSLSQTSWITLNKDSRTDLSKMLIIICQEVSSHIFFKQKFHKTLSKFRNLYNIVFTG